MTDSHEQKLADLRRQIDAVDASIIASLNQRARLAMAVGEVKHETGAPVYRPEREAQVLAKQAAANQGPLSAVAITSIYREVISACRELERRMRVAYLGPAGTFSEEALRRHFGDGVDAISCSSIDEVFRATESGGCDFRRCTNREFNRRCSQSHDGSFAAHPPRNQR